MAGVSASIDQRVQAPRRHDKPRTIDGSRPLGFLLARIGGFALPSLALPILAHLVAKTKRTQFKDYAYWQPQLFTDKNGKASFAVQYPDNVTGWQSHIIAIDKKLHVGKTSFITQSYKPVMAQLSMPQFATEGDSMVLNGKALNYTKETFSLQTDFVISNGQHAAQNKTIGPVQSENIWMPVQVNNTDTLNISFSLQTNTGFKDGEERKLPVVPQGTVETNGIFSVLQGDTLITYHPSSLNALVEIYANNKTLDIFLDEIEHIKKYPWYCMEQTASKLKAFLMKDEIDAVLLHNKTKTDKEKDLLLEKLLKTQLFNGGWSWWPRTSSTTSRIAFLQWMARA